jgi:hypothetical protein
MSAKLDPGSTGTCFPQRPALAVEGTEHLPVIQLDPGGIEILAGAGLERVERGCVGRAEAADMWWCRVFGQGRKFCGGEVEDTIRAMRALAELLQALLQLRQCPVRLRVQLQASGQGRAQQRARGPRPAAAACRPHPHRNHRCTPGAAAAPCCKRALPGEHARQAHRSTGKSHHP